MNLDDRDLASDLVDARVDKFLADRGGGVRWIGFGRKHLGEGDEQEREGHDDALRRLTSMINSGSCRGEGVYAPLGRVFLSCTVAESQ
jgi:hypothetical protein